MKTYVLDTHALVWYLAKDPRLGAQAEAIMDDPSSGNLPNLSGNLKDYLREKQMLLQQRLPAA